MTVGGSGFALLRHTVRYRTSPTQRETTTPAPAAMPIIAPNERLKGVDDVEVEEDRTTAPTEEDGEGELVADDVGVEDGDGHGGTAIVKGGVIM